MSSLKHLAFIMDGNRRWAKKNNIDYKKLYTEIKGLKFKQLIKFYRKRKSEYKEFYDNVILILRKCIKLGIDKGIQDLSFYTFSIENLNRSKEEKKLLFSLFKIFVNLTRLYNIKP